MQPEQTAALDAVKTLVRERCGLHGDLPGQQTTAEAVAARMAACGVADMAQYVRRLHGHEQELLALVEGLTVNVSYLYREPAHDRLVFEHVLEPMLASSDAPVRIWSAGCACGEELVSLAIALSERYGEAMLDRFAFAGADIDRGALRVAAAGQYGEAALHALPQALRARYFTPLAGGGAVLREQLRRRLHYSLVNLAGAAPCPAPRDQDLIFYRNVSIYFGRSARISALRHLAAHLAPGGVLVPGAGEVGSNDLGILRVIRHGSFQGFTRHTSD